MILFIVFISLLRSAHALAEDCIPISTEGRVQSVSHEQFVTAYEKIRPDSEPMPHWSRQRQAELETSAQQAGLLMDEANSIFAYTARFYHVNQELRLPHPRPEALLYASVLSVGLRKLPPFVGTVYRNMFPFPQWRDRYLKNKPVLEEAFTSTRTDAKDGPMMSREEPIRFVIESKTGRQIREFSAYRDKEDEVLFPPQTWFLVRNVETLKQYIERWQETVPVTQITMDEVPYCP